MCHILAVLGGTIFTASCWDPSRWFNRTRGHLTSPAVFARNAAALRSAIICVVVRAVRSAHPYVTAHGDTAVATAHVVLHISLNIGAYHGTNHSTNHSLVDVRGRGYSYAATAVGVLLQLSLSSYCTCSYSS